MRALRLPGNLVRSMFKRRKGAVPTLSERFESRHTDVPALRGAEVAALLQPAVWRATSTNFCGGDVARTVRTARPGGPPGRHARDSHCHAEHVPNPGTATFCGADLNEAEAMIASCHDSTAPFCNLRGGAELSGVYRLLQRGSGYGVLHQRGHTPGLMRTAAASRHWQRPDCHSVFFPRNAERVDLALMPGAVLLIISRGIVERVWRQGVRAGRGAGELAERHRHQRPGFVPDRASDRPAIHAGSTHS